MIQEDFLKLCHKYFGKYIYKNQKLDEYVFRKGGIIYFLDIYVSYDECRIYLRRSDSDNEHIFLHGIEIETYTKQEIIYRFKECLNILKLCSKLV